MSTTVAEVQSLIEQFESGKLMFDKQLARLDEAYQAGVRKLQEAAEVLGDFVNTLIDALTSAYRWLKTQLAALAAEIDKIWNLIKATGVAIVKMLEYNDMWAVIAGLANSVATDVENPNTRVGRRWEGDAAKAYFDIVVPQVAAARRIGTTADLTRKTLNEMAAAGIIYLTASVAALIKAAELAAAAVAALIAGAAPLSAAAAVAVAAVAVALIAAFALFIAAQDSLASTMMAEAKNPTGFPGGAWPKAASSVSIDVTAADGDKADWIPKPP
jgi:hypothetical protein